MPWLHSHGIWMTHWWPRLVRGMPRVQKIEPVWIGAGQELSGESTNCSKLTFVPPGGTQTGIDRQSDPTGEKGGGQLSSSLHHSHLIVFPLEMLYTDNSLYIISPPVLSPAEVPFWFWERGPCRRLSGWALVGGGGNRESADVLWIFFLHSRCSFFLIGSGSC